MNEAADKLFEVPRIAVELDESDPNVLKLAFSGTVELNRGDASEVEFYNGLKSGEQRELRVEVYVAGAQNRHRRDAEGDVDAIVQTKALVVGSVEW
jgi:hypothetical protein